MVNEHIVLPASDDTENDEISLPLGADRDDLAVLPIDVIDAFDG